MTNISQSTILIVDDVQANIELLRDILQDDYHVAGAFSGEEALEFVESNHTDLILLDIMMPGINGYDVCRRLQAQESTRNIPIIFVTAKGGEEDEAEGLQIGAVDYVNKPIKPPIVKARVKNHLELKKAREALEQQNETLENKVEERTREVTLTQDVTVQSMATLAEYRDPETGGHIKRTQHYIKTLANQLRTQERFKDQISTDLVGRLARSAPLHDIGKVGVPDHILLKPGKLTAEEFEEIKNHTVYGHDALAVSSESMGNNSFLGLGMEIAYNHHEKWDGTGYPRGLAGEDIPLSGRLMTLVDVYDALISKRVYKDPFPHKQAVDIINKDKGTHFDPDIVDAFLNVEEEFRQTALKYADFEEERQALAYSNT